MRRKILIYSDQESFTSTSHLEGELSRMFTDMAIIPIDRHQLAGLGEISNDTFLFVLPGIVGEECLYQEHIGDVGFQKIKGFIENGGAYLGFCAGAYHAFSTISYDPPNAQKKLRINSDRTIRGVAKGPIHSHYIPDDKENDFSGCTTIRVTIEGDSPVDTEICYGNGPMLCPHPDEDYKVIASYTAVEGNPAAIIAKSHGQGLVIASGLVPQYGAEPIIAEQMRLNGDCPESLISLAEELSKHETGRKLLMSKIEIQLRGHWHAVTGQQSHTKIVPAQPPQELPSNPLAVRHG